MDQVLGAFSKYLNFTLVCAIRQKKTRVSCYKSAYSMPHIMPLCQVRTREKKSYVHYHIQKVHSTDYSGKNIGLFHLHSRQVVQILVHSHFDLVSQLLALEATESVSEPVTQTVVELINIHLTRNALARVQRVHKPADLWDITFCTC